MQKICLFLALLLTSCSASKSTFMGKDLYLNENSNCEIKGNPSNWQAAYCMWLNTTNDFNNEEVKHCYDLTLRHKAIPQEPCARNKYFKNEICQMMLTEKYFNYSGTVSDCLLSEDTTPKVVKEGL